MSPNGAARKTPPSHPSLAAEIYGLQILRANVEDAAHNTTRFYVVAPNPARLDPATPDLMTTFVFRVRNVPAALYKALGGFATNGVNMTKLESYMMGGEFAATQFLCDVEGHPEQPGPRRALEELSFFLVGSPGAWGVSEGPIPLGTRSRRLMDDILVEQRDGWRKLIFNRPAKLNALTTGMLTRLLAEIDAAEADPATPRGGVDRGGTRLLRGAGGWGRLHARPRRPARSGSAGEPLPP